MTVNHRTEVDRLMDELTRPIYNLRMARPNEHLDSPMGKSCRTRANNARNEIAGVIARYTGKRLDTSAGT